MVQLIEQLTDLTDARQVCNRGAAVGGLAVVHGRLRHSACADGTASTWVNSLTLTLALALQQGLRLVAGVAELPKIQKVCVLLCPVAG